MPSRALAPALLLSLLTSSASAQSGAPDLSRAQRNALRAVVAAVDAPGTKVETPEAWPLHVLRASDGSHYVAFSLTAPPGIRAGQPVVLYVRLASRRGQTDAAERSAVAEWLAGQRSAPVKPERGLAFGDMPAYGAGSSAGGREAGTSTRGPAGQSLRMLEAERERARVQRETREQERKATLAGAETLRGPNPLLPFEDFDANLILTADRNGAVTLRRSLTAGPGDYDLTVAWTDPTAKDPAGATRILRRPVQLPTAAPSTFGLSSVVLADDVVLRETPLPADQQSAHPYSIGAMEITPARDQILTNDEQLALVVQVINPRATPEGKPDVAVGFRVFRSANGVLESVGTLTPQIYNAATLPPDFDATKGHPIFAAVAVPLTTFKRGQYRVQVMADDRLAGASATGDATFTIVGTATSLLRDAPPLAPPFRREAALTPSIVRAIVDVLTTGAASPALRQGLESLGASRFVDLVRGDSVNANERGARELLRAIGLLALGDTANAVSAPLRQAQQLNAAPAAVHFVDGAVRAIEGRERDALTAWTAAMNAGFDAAALTPLLVDSHLRLGEAPSALELATRAVAAQPGNSVLRRGLAAAQMASKQEADAIAGLEALVTEQPEDQDARWLLLHALFAGHVSGQGASTTPQGKQRLRDLAQAYIAGKGRHAALATEWAEAIR
jgi:hypothetical protein